MFAKTVCRPGSYVVIVPVGLLTTLQYNANGVLEKVFQGYGDTKVNITDTVFDSVKQLDSVPISIPIKSGTTWVEGVMYSATMHTSTGVLPACVEGDVIKDIISGHPVTFYAGNVDSLAASFRGLLTVRNWINMAGFNELPVYMISSDMTNESFMKMINTSSFPFVFPLISGYLIFNNTSVNYHHLDLTQYIVKDTEKRVDVDGYIKLNVTDSDGCTHIYHYSDAVTYNIYKGACIVSDRWDTILFSDSKKKLLGNSVVSNKLTCDFCGNTFVCPAVGPVCCSDEHCSSLMYSAICQMLHTWELPMLEKDKFSSYLTSETLTILTDVFLLPEYSECTVSIPLAKFLQGVVPITTCADSTIFSKLATLCRNNTKTLLYYIQNPRRLEEEIGFHSIMLDRLLAWLSDPYNQSTITTLLDSKQLILMESDKKFEGAPIFRGKHIAITGTFSHGDLLEVASILKSYDADVTIGLDACSDCLIIGQMNENNDGRSITEARNRNVATFSEDTFFGQYDIDADLASNLL